MSASHADPKKRATAKRMKESLEAMGLDPSAAVARARERSRTREGRKRLRSQDAAMEDADAMEEGGEDGVRVHSSKSRSVSVARRTSQVRSSSRAAAGLKDDAERMRAQKMADKAERKRNKRAKIGEADRTIITKMPKHLFSGKRGIGKTDRR